MKVVTFALIAGISLAAMTAAGANYAYVGSGDKFAKVLVEFSDRAIYAFGVSFSDANTTGIGLMDLIESGTTLTTVRVNDPYFGTYIDGISYEGHSNSGYGGGAMWWHYWGKDPSADWALSWVGASSRIATNGCADGWIYGLDDAPRLPGDATGDVSVDDTDFGAIARNWMQSGRTWADGDFTGDGVVNGDDFSALARFWGFGQAPSSSASIPEPATIVLLAGGSLLWLRRNVG